MSEPYTYHFDEGVLAVPPGFRDDSLQVLEWPVEGGALVLAISRRPLGGAFEAVVEKDVAQAKAGLRACVVEVSQASTLGGEPAHVLTMRYVKDGRVLHHRQVFAVVRGRLWAMFVTGPAAHRAAIDALFGETIDSFKFRE